MYTYIYDYYIVVTDRHTSSYHLHNLHTHFPHCTMIHTQKKNENEKTQIIIWMIMTRFLYYIHSFSFLASLTYRVIYIFCIRKMCTVWQFLSKRFRCRTIIWPIQHLRSTYLQSDIIKRQKIQKQWKWSTLFFERNHIDMANFLVLYVSYFSMLF